MPLYLLMLIISIPNNMKSRSQQPIVFTPDTTINTRIILENSRSIEMTFGSIMEQLDTSKSLPDVVFFNRTPTEYLRLVFFPGSSKHKFSYFEVGSLSKLTINEGYTTQFRTFQTESGVRLGMSKVELLDIKGTNFTKEMQGDTLSLTYTLNDPANSTFLQRYKMPSYQAKYYFHKDIIISFEFGFDYP